MKKKSPNSVIHQPSDKLFKAAMGDLKLAKEFIQTHLPVEMVETLDLATLQSQNNTYIDESYKTKESDVLYQVQLKESRSPAYIYLLFELQTEVDHYMAFRLWGYIMRIMEEHRKKYPNSPLPLVYPLLVYAGKKRWDAPRDIFPLFGDQESFAREWMFKPYQLWDIQRISDEALRENILSGLMEFTLKHRATRDFKVFMEVLIAWIKTVEEQHENGSFLGRTMLKYVLNAMEASNADLFVEQLNQSTLSQPLQEEIMTLAQAFVEKGREEGMQRGIQRGMEKGIQRGEATLLLYLIENRFGPMPNNYKKIIQEADEDSLLLWGKRILNVQSLEDVFK